MSYDHNQKVIGKDIKLKTEGGNDFIYSDSSKNHMRFAKETYYYGSKLDDLSREAFQIFLNHFNMTLYLDGISDFGFYGNTYAVLSFFNVGSCKFTLPKHYSKIKFKQSGSSSINVMFTISNDGVFSISSGQEGNGITVYFNEVGLGLNVFQTFNGKNFSMNEKRRFFNSELVTGVLDGVTKSEYSSTTETSSDPFLLQYYSKGCRTTTQHRYGVDNLVGKVENNPLGEEITSEEMKQGQFLFNKDEDFETGTNNDIVHGRQSYSKFQPILLDQNLYIGDYIAHSCALQKIGDSLHYIITNNESVQEKVMALEPYDRVLLYIRQPAYGSRIKKKAANGTENDDYIEISSSTQIGSDSPSNYMRIRTFSYDSGGIFCIQDGTLTTVVNGKIDFQDMWVCDITDGLDVISKQIIITNSGIKLASNDYINGADFIEATPSKDIYYLNKDCFGHYSVVDYSSTYSENTNPLNRNYAGNRTDGRNKTTDGAYQSQYAHSGVGYNGPGSSGSNTIRKYNSAIQNGVYPNITFCNFPRLIDFANQAQNYIGLVSNTVESYCLGISETANTSDTALYLKGAVHTVNGIIKRNPLTIKTSLSGTVTRDEDSCISLGDYSKKNHGTVNVYMYKNNKMDSYGYGIIVGQQTTENTQGVKEVTKANPSFSSAPITPPSIKLKSRPSASDLNSKGIYEITNTNNEPVCLYTGVREDTSLGIVYEYQITIEPNQTTEGMIDILSSKRSLSVSNYVYFTNEAGLNNSELTPVENPMRILRNGSQYTNKSNNTVGTYNYNQSAGCGQRQPNPLKNQHNLEKDATREVTGSVLITCDQLPLDGNKVVDKPGQNGAGAYRFS